MISTEVLATKFKIALIQMRVEPNNPATNFTHAVSQIRSAASSTPDLTLAILPEYHLTAFVPSSPKFIPACQTSHNYLERYQTLARELQICICPGTIVLTPTPEDPAVTTYSNTNRPILLNTAYFISPDGEIIGSYTKVNLWSLEREHLTPSTSKHAPPAFKSVPHDASSDERIRKNPHRAFDTPLGKVGILTCWDVAYPEPFRELVKQGAKIILIPNAWMEDDLKDEGHTLNPIVETMFLQTTLIARAYENTCALVFCNVAGPANEGYVGLSQVTLPMVGPVKGSFTDAQEGFKVVGLDMDVVELAERTYKLRADFTRDDWYYDHMK